MGQKQSISECVLHNLREDIINCVYKPGEIITETEVAQAYGSSKTPAREALATLCIEGYLRKFPRKGYLVKMISLSNLQSLFQFRCIIESASAELAATHATEADIRVLKKIEEQIETYKNEDTMAGHVQQHDTSNETFHMQIARMSYNPYLISTTANILRQLRRALMLDLMSPESEKAFEGHPDIIQAIELKKPQEAKQAMILHINEAQDRIYIQNFQYSKFTDDTMEYIE